MFINQKVESSRLRVQNDEQKEREEQIVRMEEFGLGAKTSSILNPETIPYYHSIIIWLEPGKPGRDETDSYT